MPPEQPVALHLSTPIMRLIPSSLTTTNDTVALGADQHFQIFLSVSHIAWVAVQAFQILSSALCSPRSNVKVPTSIATLKQCHVKPCLTYCNPLSIPPYTPL